MAGPSDRRTDRPRQSPDDDRTGDESQTGDESVRATSRRRLLATGGAVAAAAIAGCSDYLPDGMASFDELGGAADTPTTSPDPTAPDTDVVSLQYRSDGSTYEFIVGLEPPTGSSGANWWQVETLDGERLVRKEFAEPRTDRVTTSTAVEIDDPSGVVVRGHDVDAGYGGQVMLADLASGDPPVVEVQGHDRESFADYSF